MAWHFRLQRYGNARASRRSDSLVDAILACALIDGIDHDQDVDDAYTKCVQELVFHVIEWDGGLAYGHATSEGRLLETYEVHNDLRVKRFNPRETG